MKIPRLTVITLGVSNLPAATEFYRSVLATTPNTSNDGVTFFEMPGSWLSLFPIENLAKDIAPDMSPLHSGFNGMTLAHNARSKDELIAMIERARSAGAKILKEPQDTFWGGFGAYFSDPDGYIWEIVWGPMFEFTGYGDLKFKPM